MRRHLERRVRRGLTYQELAQETGISKHTLSWWAWRLRRESASKPVFVELEVAVPEREPENAIDVLLESGRRLQVRPGFDQETLLRLVSALESAC